MTLAQRAPSTKVDADRVVAILTPVYNVMPWPDAFVEAFNAMVADVAAIGRRVVLVLVDDGSERPGTRLADHARRVRDLACPCLLARHPINRGQGAALQTALELAREQLPDAVAFVTLDGDCQHDPRDVPALIGTLEQRRVNIVFGTRFAPEVRGLGGMPRSRRLILLLGRVFDRVTTGLALTDAHNGFRAFDQQAAGRIALQHDRMAHATEFKMIIARERLAYAECPVVIRYTDESLKHGQSNLNAINIVRELLEGWWFQ